MEKIWIISKIILLCGTISLGCNDLKENDVILTFDPSDAKEIVEQTIVNVTLTLNITTNSNYNWFSYELSRKRGLPRDVEIMESDKVFTLIKSENYFNDNFDERNRSINTTVIYESFISLKALFMSKNEFLIKVYCSKTKPEKETPAVQSTNNHLLEVNSTVTILPAYLSSSQQDDLSLDNYNQTIILREYTFFMTVVREESVLNLIFLIILPFILVWNTILYGCSLDLQIIRGYLRRPLGPAVGLFCQFVFLPLVAYAVIRIIQLEKGLALGLFAIGCSPGGGSSNTWSILLDGELNLSIVMTFFSTFLSVAMMPLWLYTLGYTFVDDDVTIPFENIFISLATLVFGLIIGILIKRFLPKIGNILIKLIKPSALFTVLFIVIVGIISNLYIFTLLDDWKVLLSGMMLPWASLIAGTITAFLFRFSWPKIRTIGIEVMIQNTGIPIVLLRYSLPNPDGEISSVMPIAASLFTPVPLWISFIVLQIRKRCCKKNSEKEDSIEMKEEPIVTDKKTEDLDENENGDILRERTRTQEKTHN